MPGQATRLRQQQIVTFQQNSLVPSNPLGLGYLYREMMLTLRGSVTTSADMTPQNVKGGDEWGVIQKLEIVVNGADVLRSITGEQLKMMNAFWYDRPLTPSTAFNATPQAVPFDSTLIIPFWDQWGREPLDTLLDSSKLSELKVHVTWGNAVNITSAADAAFSVDPTLTISSKEAFGLNPNIKYQVARQFQIQNAAAVPAQNEYTVLLPLGNIYKGFWINTKAAGGLDLEGCIDRVRLVSGTLDYINMDFKVLRDWYNLRSGLINGVVDTSRDPMPFGFSAQTLNGAWTYISLVDDGFLTEAIDTYQLSELKLIFQTNQTITQFTIIPDMIVPVR